MRKVYFFIFIIVFLAITNIVDAQTYVWIGGPTGDYQVATNWSPSRNAVSAADVLQFNAITPIAVTNVANQTIGSVQILSGTNAVSFASNLNNILTLGAAVPLIYTTPGSILSANLLTIRLNNAASFNISSGVFGIDPGSGGKIILNGPLALIGGTLDFDVIGTGGTTVNAPGSITYTTGVFTSASSSAITWNTGANYYHAVSGALPNAIPAATWALGSTCNITGMNVASAQAPTGFAGINFANFTWNCTGQVSFVDLNMPASTVFFTGAFTILSTGSNYVGLGSASGASLNVASYNQIGGRVRLQSSSGNTTLLVTGNFSNASGTIDWVGGSSGGSATLNLQKDVSKGGSTWSCSSTSNAAQMILQFSGSSLQTVSIGGAWSNPNAGRCNIVNNNTDPINGVNLSGTLKVVNTSSASPASFTMNGKVFSGSGVVSYAGITSLIYSGPSFQTTTAIEFPVSSGPYNLTINNSVGVMFPNNFNRIIPGTLTMLNGNLAIDDGNTGNKLELSNSTLATQLSYTSGFITTGKLGRYFIHSALPNSLATSARYPFGTGINDRSMNVYFSTNVGSGLDGYIYVTHTPVIGVQTMGPIMDAGSSLDKRTMTYWTVSTTGGSFSLGGSETISLTATAANIGVVNDYKTLRLTDGSSTLPYGTGLAPIANTGSDAIPVTGKSGLTIADLNKPLYIGGDLINPLIIITYTWTGAVNNNWAESGNWTSSTTGYPSASTEIALVTNPTILQPTINAGENISVFQLTVTSSHTLTMAGNAILTVYDNIPNFDGTAVFDVLSTFGYASPSNAQTIIDLPYANLTISGAGIKNFGPTIRVRNKYTWSGFAPNIGTSTFIYEGTGAQRIEYANYYNLTIKNDRGGATITSGNYLFLGTIDIANIFDVSTLTNYSNPPLLPISFATVRFSSLGAQIIPGFYYNLITSADGPRTLDPLGSTVPSHVIYTRSLAHGSGAYTVAGSKVNLYVSGLINPLYSGDTYFDFEISGNLNGYTIDFANAGRTYIGGKFTVSLTNYKQGPNNNFEFNFNGTGDQVITAFKADNATNTPAFKYSNLTIAGGNRNVLLGGDGTDTIPIRGILKPEYIGPGTSVPFTGGKGFIVGNSVVDFNTLGATIPVLKHFTSPDSTYNHLVVSSSSRALEGNMIIGGNLSVTGTDASPTTLTLGGGGGVARTLTVLGNMIATGTGTGSQVTGQIDLNPGTAGSTMVNLAGNLSISGNGQLMGTTSTGTNNGKIVFNGSLPQTYSNTSTFKNGLVNFNVGDGIGKSKLTLLSSIDLFRSSNNANKGTLNVLYQDTLDCGIYNIISNGTGNAIFNLADSATLITANAGGVEGIATTPANGSISNDGNIVRTYSDIASYTFNGATTTPFSATSAITKMANLTIGANVTLDKSIFTSNTFTLGAFSFGLSNFDLTLTSTSTNTAKVATVPGGATINYGSGRFNVERNYRGLRRAWYLVTSPLTETGSVYDTWQIGGANTAGRGTFVTGTIAGTVANGLDNGPQLNSSLKAGDALTVVNDTKATLLSSGAASAANKGYFLFVRGDRTTVNNYNTAVWNATTLSSRGKIQIGAQTFAASSTLGAYTLIGNPYASPVSVTAAARTNLNTIFWVWDPYLNSTLGGYITILLDGSGNVSSITPSTSPGGLATVGQPFVVQSSQAFWVQTFNNGAAQVQFNEVNKSAAFNVGSFRQMRDLTKSFRTNLNLVEVNDSIILADGNLVQFDNQYGKEVDLNDAVKFGNIRETFGFLRDSKSLSVERRPEITGNDTLFFKLTKTEQRNYQFQFVPTNMAGILTAYLEDSYTNAKTIVSLNSTSTFNFSINGDAASAAPDRFKIVFNAAVVGPLPVTYKSIKAYQQGADIAVEWTVENEINISKYEVEKSTDGVNFTTINTTTAKGTSGSIDYKIVDNKAVAGNNFYRILSYNQGGGFEYSKVVLVKLGKTHGGISIYPNPVTGNTIGVAMTDMKQGIYQVRLINTAGQILMTKRVTHASGNSMETFTPDSKLSAGIYNLEVTAPDKRISNVKVIVK